MKWGVAVSSLSLCEDQVTVNNLYKMSNTVHFSVQLQNYKKVTT